jgi:type IV secretion system protein TrbE
VLNLTEYKKKPNKLTDYLPWASLVAPGIILNKDGSFQRSFSFRGPDLDSATQSELVSITARLNNALKRLGGGWGIYCEAQRIKSQGYQKSEFPDPVTLMIDEERRNYFSDGNHYENHYYLTLVFLPPADQHKKFEDFFIERGEEIVAETYEVHLKTFINECDRLYYLLAEIFPLAQPLDDDETLTYLHSCVSPVRHFVKTPETPMYLDAILADTPLIPGLEPRLGNYHLRVVSILGFPGSTTPGILDNLNKLNFEYRWVTRFLPIDKKDAIDELKRYQRKWFSKRKGLLTLIKEVVTGTESALVDNDATNKAMDADGALQEVSDDLVSYGYFTATAIVWDEDYNTVEKKVRALEKTINGLGFTVINETLNAVDAWFGSLPGLCRANVRRPLLNTLNLAHIFPLSAVWAGPEKNKHLNAPVLIQTQTSGHTPFRLDLHATGDVGHTMIIGPTGTGKSVLLSFIAAQFRRYKDAQVYYFDKDASVKALTAGIGGDFYDLAADGSALAFQPLAAIDNGMERAWAAEWIHEFLVSENVVVTPEVKKSVWTALVSLSVSPREERTMTGFSLLLQDAKLRQALEPATINGAFGRLFDSNFDNLAYGRWQVFEMAKLMNLKAAVRPTLSYLFHRLEQRFTGYPTILVLDECWMFLDNPIFAAKIREWLKVLRKANVAVVFASQSLSDVENSTIATVIKESCPTKIFLPNNNNALDDRIAAIYRGYGLNDREIEIIALATPKRQYYYKSIVGCRLFELALSPAALAYCAASTPEDRKMVSEIQAIKDDFNCQWLGSWKNLPDALEFYKTIIKKEAA